MSASRLRIPPSMAWLAVFLPALVYVASTRMSQAGFRLGRSNTLGTLVSDRIHSTASCQDVSQALRVDCSSLSDDASHNSLTLTYGLHEIATADSIVASQWAHDEELGRGFLLLSQSSGQGRIWRWEVGGGPIAIGKTLHLDQAGCRSRQVCRGSGGLAVDFRGEHPGDGFLVVAEWGEERVSRLEENGARTPLVLQRPSTANNGTQQKIVRVIRPRDLTMTLQGHLVFVDDNDDDDLPKASTAIDQPAGDSIFVQRYIPYVDPLESLRASRAAHQWTEIPARSREYDIPKLPSILYAAGTRIGGIATSPTFSNLCLTEQTAEGHVFLRQISLNSMDDNFDAELHDLLHGRPAFSEWDEIRLDTILPTAVAGPLAVSSEGRVFLGLAHGVAIVDPTRSQNGQQLILGILDLPQPPTSLTIGADGFLYVTSATKLFRMAIRDRPVQIPVDKVQRPPKK